MGSGRHRLVQFGYHLFPFFVLMLVSETDREPYVEGVLDVGCQLLRVGVAGLGELVMQRMRLLDQVVALSELPDFSI